MTEADYQAMAARTERARRESRLRKGEVHHTKYGGGFTEGAVPPNTSPPTEPEIIVNERVNTVEENLNKTEKRFLAHIRGLGIYDHVGIQDITFRLAHDCRLTPDFTTRTKSGILTFWDVKGFQREDALIKMRIAAATYYFWFFVIVKWEDGQWTERIVKP